ncbi:uncharacterized protein LOC106459860 [Limulus polyphemus]|uniref:Uncharacterized protein LOC106459860 n=1 Tax=Limulus polyphemus TaxID=6850 RepID=A0ABM1B525_LIMPO|nr:uncharacterized protein LOC106459860 [Limulus polyphemus]
MMQVKEKLLRPYFVSYRDLLRRNIEEVVRQLATTDPAYFLSVLELLQGRNCSRVDFKKIDMMFKSPGIEPVVKEFWKVWGHEQISRQVFPATVTNVSLTKPLYNAIPGMFRTLPDVADGSVNINAFPHVPIKEGLHSVIKCLKTQDISQSKTKSDLVDTKARSCVCSVCKIPSLASRPSSRLRMYGEFTVKNTHHTSTETQLLEVTKGGTETQLPEVTKGGTETQLPEVIMGGTETHLLEVTMGGTET